MQLVKVKNEFYNLCRKNNVDKELMSNKNGRPCVLIVRLKYKSKKRNFVVPLRSNISPKTPRNQYFNLPPNSNTKSYHHHGIHYIKIFPIDSQYVDKFKIEDNSYFNTINRIIGKSEKAITSACQEYLSAYEKGLGHHMTPDIDGIIDMIDTLKKANVHTVKIHI